MALISTAILGGLVWLWGLSEGDHRAARGNGAWVAWLILFVFVAAVVGAWVRRVQRSSGDEGRTIWRGVRDNALLSIVAAVVAIFAMSEASGDFGVEESAAVLLAMALIPAGVVLTVLAPTLFPSATSVSSPRTPALSPVATVLALSPMLLPAAVLFAQTHLPVSAAWDGRISGLGLAGITFLHLETVTWPGTLLVAVALDRVVSGRMGSVQLTVAALSLLALLLCVAVPPIFEDDSVFSLGRPSPAQAMGEPLSFTPLLRTASAMLLACSALTVSWLLRTRRAAGSPPLVAFALLFGLPLILFGVAAESPPEDIPMAGVLGCVAAFVVTELTDRRRGNVLA